MAHVSGRSGHLHLAHGQEHRGLTLREGHIVQGRSDVPGEHLDDVLVRQGLLAPDQVAAAVTTVLAERRPLGAVLLDLHLLERERLEEAIGCHAREVLLAAIERPSGSASFEEVGDLPGGGEPGLVSRLPTGQILLEAARRLTDPDAVRDALGDLDRKLALPADPRLRAQSLALTPSDGFVLSRVDGTSSARELIALGPLAPDETERSLLALLCAGAVVPVADRPAVRRPAVAPTPPAAAPTPPAAAPDPTPAPEAPAAPAGPPPLSPRGPQDVRRLILETYEGLVSRDHFELLAVSRDATADEIRAAYARLARTLHPDACRDPLLAEVDAQREAVFLRVCRAYEILRDPDSRAAYERDVCRRKPRPAPRRVPAVTFSAPAVTFSAPAVTFSAPRRATPPPPEPPLPPPPPSLPAASPPKAEPPPSPAAPVPSLDERLAETIAKGEGLLHEGQYWEAIRQLEPTLQNARGELRVRARLALARACLKNPKWGKRAEAHLHDALQTDPLRTEAYLLLGDIYRDGGLSARAASMYRKVLDLQPQHHQARRELARLEAVAPTTDEGGLLGFLKKR